MAVANTTAYDDLFTKLLVEAQFQAYEQSIARSVTTTFDVTGQSGKVIQVPVYSAVSAAAFTEGTAPTATAPGTTNVDITLGEIGVYHQVSDMLRDSAGRDVFADLGMQMGMAIAEKLDSDVFGLFNSFTSSQGTEDAAAGLTTTDIFTAVATLRANKVTGPLVAVLHPEQALDLKKEIYGGSGSIGTGISTGVTDSVMRGFYIGELAGCQIFESSLLKTDLDTDADNTDNIVGAVFAPSAIGTAIRGDMSMEQDRNAPARATDLVMTMVKGQAILNQNHGVKIISIND